MLEWIRDGWPGEIDEGHTTMHKAARKEELTDWVGTNQNIKYEI